MGEVQAHTGESLPVSPSLGNESGWDDVRQEIFTHILVVLPVLGLVLILGANVFSDPLYGGVLGLILLLLPFAVGGLALLGLADLWLDFRR
ncbi:MAG: hypothetical protein MUQ10_01945, partial [Anaerolineae bacterium]|nr:hypothetical protein [Anaerolineae bacterium]